MKMNKSRQAPAGRKTRNQGNIRMRLPKTEVDRRTKVVLEYFKKNPNATGEQMNKALTSGALTGKKEPALNIKKVYDLRKEAKQAIAAAEVPPGLPADAFRSARRFDNGSGVAQSVPSLTEAARRHVQGLVLEFRNLPPEILDITVRRDGTVGMGLVARMEQQVNLGSAPGATA